MTNKISNAIDNINLFIDINKEKIISSISKIDLSFDINKIELAFAKMQFGLKPRTMMYKKIASFSKQGTPVFQTIEMFEKAYSEKKGDARAPILREWAASMSDGFSFSEAITGFAPDSEVMLISAGESNGDLEGGMKKAIFISESTAKIRSALIGGLSYSGILILTLVGMIVMFSLKVIPQMTEVMPVGEWPPLSKKLYDMSMFVKNYGAVVGGTSVTLLVISIKTLGVFVGPIRRHLDRLPPWNIYKTIQGSVFLITLSSMMNAGIPLNNALYRIRDMSPPYLAGYINAMTELLVTGGMNGEVMDVGLLDYDTSLDIKLLGQTADFQSAMMMIGEESIEGALSKIHTITAAIGTGVLFAITGFIMFVYSGFFTLTMAITDAASAVH